MIALQVEYLSGPNAGRKLLMRQARISFGRSDDRALPIDLPTASREHGEFVFEQGRWPLVDHSNNGTRLGGKRVTTKPRPIKTVATVAIGDTKVFRVIPIADTSALTEAQHDTVGETDIDLSGNDANTTVGGQAEGVETTAKGRGKLWIGITVFWVVCFGLISFALLNPSDNSPSTPGSNLPKPLSAEAINAYIHQPIEKQTPDQRKADTAIAQAREAYVLIDRRPDALYRAYEAYRNALTYLPGDSLPDATDERQYYLLQKRLTDRVTELYEDANFLFSSRQYKAADEAFKQLRTFYPDSLSPVFQDALKREAAARKAMK